MPAAGHRDKEGRAPGGAISPLVPVLVPLAVAAILIGVWFSRLFPFASPPSAPPPVRFTDVTRESGISFDHDNGSRGEDQAPTTLPGAVAFLDYDIDGRPDIFFGTRPWRASPRRPRFITTTGTGTLRM